MKNLLVTSVFIILSLIPGTLFSQDPESGRNKEFHFRVLPFDGFSFTYKTENKNHNFFRIGLTAFDCNLISPKSDMASTVYFNSGNFSAGIHLGIEKRKYITEKLSAFFGINVFTDIEIDKYKIDDPYLFPKSLREKKDSQLRTGLSFNSGFMYNFNDNFSLSAEVVPMLTYSHSSHESINGAVKTKDLFNTYSAGIYNHSALVSLVYRWTKK